MFILKAARTYYGVNFASELKVEKQSLDDL